MEEVQGVREAEVFVHNDKGTEFVGSVRCAEFPGMPEKIVFEDYSRAPEVLSASKWPERLEWSGRAVSLEPAGGKIEGFAAFLRGRKKAAIATCCDEGSGEPFAVLALLPDAPPGLAIGGGLAAAIFGPAGGGRKRPLEADEEDAAVADDAPAHKRLRVDLFDGEGVRAALAARLPTWTTKRSKDAHAEAMVFQDGQGGAVYYQDARRKYEFYCGAEGLRLLVGLVERTRVVLEKNAAILATLDPAEAKKLVSEGRKIYGEKPSLRKFGGKTKGDGLNVTWSDAEYAHVGLQTQYLRLKSFQRFTETYNLVARACGRDETARKVLLESPVLRVSSLGGGPAFEVDALREYVLKHAKQPTDLRLYSIDLQPGWAPYAEALGCAFEAPFDVLERSPDDLVNASGGKPIDVLVISYLLIYCTTDRTADLFHNLLSRNLVKVLLISERTHGQDIVKMLERRGLAVVPLMPQQNGTDQRQLLVLSADSRRPLKDEPDAYPDPVFPNVPFARGT